MAPKRPHSIEETSSGEGRGDFLESSSDEEEVRIDQTVSPSKKSEFTTPATISTHRPQSSGSAAGSDTESDKDSESEATPLDVKPITTIPMEDFRPRSNVVALPAKSSIRREKKLKDAKRAKKEDANGVSPGDDSKKLLFQRLWSEEDEIAMLKGMLDYAMIKGKNPHDEMDLFYEFIRGSFSAEATKTQLVDKIRRLRKKYKNNLVRGKKGKERSFSNPHEQKSFDLSKKIWGNEGILESPVVKSNGKESKHHRGSSKALTDDEKNKGGNPNPNPSPNPKTKPKPPSFDADVDVDVDKSDKQETGSSSTSAVPVYNLMREFGVDEATINQGWKMMEGSKKAVMEEKWKKLRLIQLEYLSQKSEFVMETAKLMSDAFKGSSRSSPSR